MRHGRVTAAGWRAAHWNAIGQLIATARGFLGPDVSNNQAEYHGLIAAMERALATSATNDVVLFEVDTKVVARQVLRFCVGKYACKTESLKPLFLRCVGIGHRLDHAGVKWRIRHVYREFNQTADSLANEGIDVGSARWSDE